VEEHAEDCVVQVQARGVAAAAALAAEGPFGL